LSEAVGLAISSGQWLLEQPDDPRKWQRNNLDVKICGEEGFTAIAQDIMTARHSIDIICYGFDPAMELVRHGTQWPRGSTFGDLLAQAANAGKRVRVLCWYGPIGAEMRGAAQAVQRLARRSRETRGQGAMYRPAHHFVGMPGASVSEARREFNIGWYEQIFAGDIQGLAFRSRRLSGQAAKAGLAADEQAPERGALETFGMAVAATHHQKTILIDYDLEDGAHAVGYVMGLNSLTDYWDTTDHLFEQPLRGDASEGADDSLPGLKPYQDYACRIRGEALADVSKNFCDAWNRTRATEKGGEGPSAIYRRQTKLAASLDAPYQCAQIVRTQPEEAAEHSVRRLYEQAAKFARKYVYVENQYFQYTPWAEQLKNERRSYVQKWKAGQGNHGQKNTTPPPLPWLHVFVVVPTPERSLMVPRTHDTVKSLGHGESMRNQDQRIEDELKRHRRQKTAYDDYMRRAREPGASTFGLGMAPPVPTPLSPLAQDSQSLGDKSDIKKDLQTISMRTLVASLWTYDHGYKERQKKSLATLKEWEDSATPRRDGKDNSLSSARTAGLRNKLAAERYREIYIHSKLLLIDDGFFTLGSANLNQRSMASDSEINVATDNPKAAADLRRRVWGLHTGGAEKCSPAGNSDGEIANAFKQWEETLRSNAEKMLGGAELKGFLIPFHDTRSTSVRAG
jgi:phosphatidylserine/phosphatidylglycerophosphate/cardiolipin synthase-like enzyme